MRTKRIRTADLHISPSYQRSINRGLVKKIANDFDMSAFGVLTVGERADGSLWIVDGQHRYQAAVSLGVKKLECVVFDSDGPQHEAAKFRLVNTQKGIGKKDIVKALYAEDDARTLDMFAQMKSAGFWADGIAPGDGEGLLKLKGIQEVENCYNSGCLREVLLVLRLAFSDHMSCQTEGKHARSAVLMRGVREFITKYGDATDTKRLGRKMRLKSPSWYVAQRIGGGGGSCLRFIVEQWNHKLGQDKKIAS